MKFLAPLICLVLLALTFYRFTPLPKIFASPPPEQFPLDLPLDHSRPLPTKPLIVTITPLDSTYELVLDAINHQTPYYCTFSCDLFDREEKATFDLENVTLEHALRVIFRNKEVKWTIYKEALLLHDPVYGQARADELLERVGNNFGNVESDSGAVVGLSDENTRFPFVVK